MPHSLTNNKFLSAAMGFCRMEMAMYKELDPTVRLVILKVLCEIRADVLNPALLFFFFLTVVMC